MKQIMYPNANIPADTDMIMARIQKDYFLCSKDSDLTQIGCSFGLEQENNHNIQKVSMLGPQNTIFADDVLSIKVYFPADYPKKIQIC